MKDVVLVGFSNELNIAEKIFNETNVFLSPGKNDPVVSEAES